MWTLAVLTGWPHKQGFIIRKCMGVSSGQKKSGHNNAVAIRRGSTVQYFTKCNYTTKVHFVFIMYIVLFTDSLSKRLSTRDSINNNVRGT